MPEPAADSHEFYARPGVITDPGEHASLFDGLPAGIPALCWLVQGILIHVFWADRYGLQVPDERKGEVEIRRASHKLARILELDGRPLTAPRPLDRRLVSNCRDFATVLCAMLRHQGVPARARCGFGTYFEPGKYVDHWVCEVWQPDERRWVMVDPQLDELQCQVLGIDFDPCDMPPGRFLPGGRAWQVCRAGEADPDLFGIFDMHGLWFVRGDMVRDLAALNKVELLPWDCWGLIDDKPEAEFSVEEWDLLDRVAALTLAGDEAFPELRAVYEGEPGLRVPAAIRSYGASGMQVVDWAGAAGGSP